MRYFTLFLASVLLSMGQNCEQQGAVQNAPAQSAADAQDATANGDDPGAEAINESGFIIADHTAAQAFDSIPDTVIQDVQSKYRIWYGHTSHGSQILTGMQMVYSADRRFAFNAGPTSFSVEDDGGVDLGHHGDLGWVDITRGILDQPGNDRNVIVWSWCGGASDNTKAGIAAYLNAMSKLESDYPGVVFIYMTGHLDGTGPAGNLYARNNQIRDYCRKHGKVLFDFADIESYDPAGKYYPQGTDWCEWCEAWAESHAVPACDDCAHSQCFNCYQKGRAFWWLMARLSGWSGS